MKRVLCVMESSEQDQEDTRKLYRWIRRIVREEFLKIGSSFCRAIKMAQEYKPDLIVILTEDHLNRELSTLLTHLGIEPATSSVPTLIRHKQRIAQKRKPYRKKSLLDCEDRSENASVSLTPKALSNFEDSHDDRTAANRVAEEMIRRRVVKPPRPN